MQLLVVGVSRNLTNLITVAYRGAQVQTVLLTVQPVFLAVKLYLIIIILSVTPAASAITLSGGVTGTGNLTLATTGVGTITMSGATAVNNSRYNYRFGAGTGTTTISANVGSSVTGITENSTTSALTLRGTLRS